MGPIPVPETTADCGALDRWMSIRQDWSDKGRTSRGNPGCDGGFVGNKLQPVLATEIVEGLAAHKFLGDRLPPKFAIRGLLTEQPRAFLAHDAKDAIIVEV
eukprot:jgi/Tetstr1/444704/TSEL_032552.t1